MTDKATTPTTEPAKVAQQAAADAPKPEDSGGGERGERAKLIALASGEKPAASPDKGKPGKGGKSATEAKPGEKPAEKEAERQERKERRDWVKSRQRLEARETSLTERETQFKAAETAFVSNRSKEIETFKSDPLAWLKSHNVNVRQVLLDAAKSDGEEPSAKLAREAKETAERLEKKLSEKEQQDEQSKAERAQAEARELVKQEIAGAWKEVDADEYPYLTAFYGEEQVAELATQVAIRYYQKHQREPSAGEVFGWLEQAEKDRDERSQKARAKSEGRPNGAGAPRDPGRDRAVSESAESREQPAGRSTTQDVTSRETRVSSTTAANAPEAKRRKYEQMAGG